MSHDIAWKHNGSGNWFTGSNWSGGKVPGPEADVTLTSAARDTIAFNGTDTIAALLSSNDQLALLGGTIAITGNADLGGGLTQSGGELLLGGTSNTISGGLSVTNGEIFLAAGHDLQVAGSATFGGNGGATIAGPGTFTTAGTLTIIQDDGANEAAFGDGLVWNNTGTIVDAGIFTAGMTPGIAFTILNRPGAIFDFTTDTACLMNGGDSSSNFKTTGLVEKTGGTGDTTFYATITSTGTISVQTGTLDIEDGGTIGGLITGPAVLEMAGGGTFHNALAIDTNIDFGGGTVTLAGLTATGTLDDNAAADQTGLVTLGGAVAGTLNIAGLYDITGADGIKTAGAGGMIDIAGGTLTKTGADPVTLAPAITDDGTILIESGALAITNPLTGTGAVTIGAGASFETGTADSGITVTLNLASLLILDKPSQFAGHIAGFIGGTTLDLRGLTITAATASSTGTLTLEDNGATVGTLLLTNNDSLATFTTQTDHHGGTLLEIATPAAMPGLGPTSLFGTIAAPGFSAWAPRFS